MIDDYAYTIDGPILARNVTDFVTKLQSEYNEEEVTKTFERIFLPKSNLIVHSIANIIYIFRSLIKV